MIPIKESLYFSSPVFVQNILVSLYGYKLFRERYNKNADYYLNMLLQSEKYSPDQMQRLQDERFVKIARHAIKTVPHYREWAAHEGIHENDIKSLSDLAYFPILKKDAIREKPERFLSDDLDKKGGIFTLSTSGTSGKPLTIFCDPDSRTHHYAFFSRLRSWFGLGKKSWRATLFGRIIVRSDHNKPPFWRYDFFQRNMLMSSYHLSDSNLQHYYKKLSNCVPDEIIGYPSSVYQLAGYIVRNRLDPLSPKVVFTTAETLLDHQREMIEKAFQSPVIDQYGCTEMTFFASQCEKGVMHIHPEHGIVEIVDERGMSVPSGESGLSVTTGFINMAMPLIRYEIGDVIAESDAKCSCGRPFKVLKMIEGRLDDILTTPDGRPLGRMDPIFKGRSGIYETQIVQSDYNVLEFNIVKDSRFTPQAEEELLYEIRKRTGHEMVIKINYVGSIQKESNGKFKAVIKRKFL